MIGVCLGLVWFSIAAALCIKARFRNKIRIVIAIVGFAGSVALTAAFSTTLTSWIASVVIYEALVYICVIINMVGEYVQLVSRHLTFKES